MDPKLKEQIDSLQWHHRMRLPDGSYTPGAWDQAILEGLFDAMGDRMRDKEVLDVGTLDGKWAFRAHGHHRAASVLALDIKPTPTWQAAHAAFGSPESVTFERSSLEDFVCHGGPLYDVVIDMGVYYHVEDPVRHFKAVNTCLGWDGVALIEGEIATDQVANLAFWYPDKYLNGDPTTRWVPSLVCLRTMLEYVGFVIQQEVVYADNGVRGRAFITAGVDDDE